MNPREKALRFYRHDAGAGFINMFTDLEMPFDITGLEERPPHNRSGKDFFGVPWVYEESYNTNVPDPQAPPLLTDITKWREQIVFPDIKAIDWEASARIDGVDKFDRENKIVYCSIGEGPFERLHSLMRFENALCCLLTNPQDVTSFFDRLMEMKLDIIDALAEYYRPDVINFMDDWGTQSNMFFSPAIWRKLVRPQIQKAVDRCHHHGISFEIHSCGKMEQIIPDFIEMKIDSYQGMGINDLPSIMPWAKGKMSFFVSLRYQPLEAARVAGTLTEQQVRKLVREELESYRQTGAAFSPFIMPLNGDVWWVPIAMEEINCFEKEYYHQL